MEPGPDKEEVIVAVALPDSGHIEATVLREMNQFRTENKLFLISSEERRFTHR